MMQDWFLDAKLGIFIHYGIYAVRSVSESWSFFNGTISYDAYMQQLDGFTASKLNMSDWVDLIRRSGARYAVLTAKHHDGVALWDTAVSDLSVVKRTPAGRDIIREYASALQGSGIRTGLYFSLIDWSEKLYPTIYAEGSVPGDYIHDKRFSSPVDGQERYDLWERFLEFNRSQITELMRNYGTVDLLWFDGDWERSARQWNMGGFRDFLHRLNPRVVLNSRLQGYGDYQTPEQGIPVVAPEGPWEFCTTLNGSWGYNVHDEAYKSPAQVIRMFADCISMGGNMLLGIGPREDGTFDERVHHVLTELGGWIRTNAEAVYGTRAGVDGRHFAGGSTLSRDRRVLYLFLYDIPREAVCLKGLQVPVRTVTILESGRTVDHHCTGGASWNDIPGIVWFSVGASDAGAYVTTLKVELAEPLRLYEGTGEVIAQNA